MEFPLQFPARFADRTGMLKLFFLTLLRNTGVALILLALVSGLPFLAIWGGVAVMAAYLIRTHKEAMI